ncbi:MAG TPA: hypothetical protein VEZ70_03635 [Allosphingosinicella sp.]|nr:hypothetical protein [Allosphingosinicella sp.]
MRDLQDVILDVVTESTGNGECIGAAEIGRRAGLDRLPAGGLGGTENANDWMGTHLLNMLLKGGAVQRCDLPGTPGGHGNRGWELAGPGGGTGGEPEEHA